MANFNFNKIILGGRLTEDPVLQTTPGGTSVTSFALAVNRPRKDKDGMSQADFFTVVAWRQTAEFVTTYFRKASSICVVGSLQTRSWVDKQGQKRFAVEVVADECFFVDARSEMPGFRNHSDVEVDPNGGGNNAVNTIKHEKCNGIMASLGIFF